MRPKMFVNFYEVEFQDLGKCANENALDKDHLEFGRVHVPLTNLKQFEQQNVLFQKLQWQTML